MTANAYAESSSGAPPDGFLIDGHCCSMLAVAEMLTMAHRLTGFSSMDTCGDY